MDLIIGAGVSGISYATFTNNEYKMFEATSEIGGYCKTIKRNGFVWDYAGHFFHFRNEGLKELVCKEIDPKTLKRVAKNTKIFYKDNYIDFPFQKNIHQLPKDEFIECLYDLFNTDETIEIKSFKDMVYANLGKGIAEKFLIPYNEKLYACDLDNLDHEAMGRFFPKANKEEIILNFKKNNTKSYNDFFVYPEGGAIEYINSLYANVDDSKVVFNEKIVSIDLENKLAKTNKGTEIKYDNLISTMPFPKLLDICGIDYEKSYYTWNKVLVFNLGFHKKGKDTESSWVYIPNKDVCFYRLGFYDNIMQTSKMSLYIEMGFPSDFEIGDTDKYLQQVLDDLKKIGVVNDEELIDYESLIMDPAYVHINKKGMSSVEKFKNELAKYSVYSIGRYGSWTYCSIEDNIIEGRRLAKKIDLNTNFNNKKYR